MFYLISNTKPSTHHIKPAAPPRLLSTRRAHSMEPRKLQPDRTGPSPGPMFGEFTGHGKVRYELSLTDSELTVRRLPRAGWTGTGSGSGNGNGAGTVYALRDFAGSRAERAPDGASFTLYFYPFKRRRVCAGLVRQRVELCFRVASTQDPQLSLEEAQRWARAVRSRARKPGGVCDEVKQPGQLLVLLNPHSGKGQAHTLFNNHVQRMLQEAGIPYTLIITERQNHARELVRETDLSQWEALVIMSGDGLLFEVVNGLMEREDWEQAIQTPLGVLPGGSGNALAASIHYYSGWQPASSEELLLSCGFMLCKGLVSNLDLISISMASGQHLFSFLSLAWGFVADVDIESEKYRHMGPARFTLGTLVRLVSLRVYQGRLAYLLAEDPHVQVSPEQSPASVDGIPSQVSSSTVFSNSHRHSSKDSSNHSHPFHNSCNSNNSHKAKQTNSSPLSGLGPPDSLLVPFDQPVPSNWTVVKEEDFVLVLAVYQSHLSEDLIAAPASRLEDGVIHLIYVKAGISRVSLLRLFLAMEKGTHLSINSPYVEYVKVRALRLEPYSPKGTLTVDGELMDYGPVQAQIHGGLARIIAGHGCT